MSTEARPVQIIADHALQSPRIYSNFVQVSMTPLDCTLTFCDVIGPQSEEEALRIQKTGTMPSPVKAVLVIPNQIVEGLIQALEAQRERQAEGMKAPTGTSVQ
ncbi:MAG: hypothetical protein DMG07_00935 [Acidobacteria bacterium]|nr:MAG: hypothetical protein DMG07_00935 [Acidobacteriota bacterium]